MPGTCGKLIDKYGLNIVYSPSFIALGEVIDNLKYPSFYLIGSDEKCSRLANIWKKIIAVSAPIMNLPLLEAEIAKLALNCYLTTKITFANHLDDICGEIADTELITKAIGLDIRIGNRYLRPGLGYGGPCFPRDNKAFQAFAKILGKQAYMAKLTDSINREQVDKWVDRIEALNPKTVGFESLSYKPGTYNREESHLLKIYNKLKKRGYNVVMGTGDVTVNHWGIRNHNAI